MGIGPRAVCRRLHEGAVLVDRCACIELPLRLRDAHAVGYRGLEEVVVSNVYDLCRGLVIRCGVAHGDGVDSWVLVFGPVLRRPVEAHVLHQPVPRVVEDLLLDADVKIVRAARVNPEAALRNLPVEELVAALGVEEVDDGVAVSNFEAEVDAVVVVSMYEGVVHESWRFDFVIEGHLVVTLLEETHFGLGPHLAGG